MKLANTIREEGIENLESRGLVYRTTSAKFTDAYKAVENHPDFSPKLLEKFAKKT